MLFAFAGGGAGNAQTAPPLATSRHRGASGGGNNGRGNGAEVSSATMTKTLSEESLIPHSDRNKKAVQVYLVETALRVPNKSCASFWGSLDPAGGGVAGRALAAGRSTVDDMSNAEYATRRPDASIC